MPLLSSVRFRFLIVGTVTCLMIVPQSLLAYCIDHVEQIQADPQLVAFLPARGDFALPKIDKEKFRRELAQRKIGALTKLMEKEGQTTQRLLERAKLHLELEQEQKAVEDYDAIIKLEPKNVEYREARLALNQQLHQYDAVEADLSELIKLDPSVQRYLDRANFYYDRWKTKEAIQDYTKVIELDGNIAEAYTRRGHIDAAITKPRTRLPDRTIGDLQKAIELDGDQILAHRTLTIIFLNSGKYAQAVQHATEILKRNEEDDCARFYRAKANRLQHKYALALEDLNTLLQKKPDASKFLVERGRLYRSMNQLDDALKDYEKAVEVNADNFATHVEIARFLASNKRYEPAIKAFQTAIAMNQANREVQADIYSDLAKCSFWVGDLKTSEQAFGKAAELYPEIASYNLQRANILRRLKRPEEALAAYDKVLAGNTMQNQAYHGRAEIFVGQGKLEEAMAEMNTCLDIKRHAYADRDIDGYKLRAKIWKLMGNEEEAAADLKHAEEQTKAKEERRAKAKAEYEAHLKAEQEAKGKP